MSNHQELFRLSRRDLVKRAAGGSALALLVEMGLLAEKAYALTTRQGDIIVTVGYSALGTPYKLPPDGLPDNTDCSLLTQYAYRQAGITIPRTAAQQYAACRYSSNQPGSLVFFATGSSRRTVTHVGINLGDGWMIDANSYEGEVVEENWRNSNYWWSRFIASATL